MVVVGGGWSPGTSGGGSQIVEGGENGVAVDVWAFSLYIQRRAPYLIG